jgi:UDP-N-acetylmuramoyl-tripeptide--D-alanyl-D-alanine ligase
MKSLLIKLIRNRSKAILAKFQPTIIAVTGSQGKTSTRRAITTVLRSRFTVRSPEKNFNNEIGVPLTVLGEKSPGKSITGWLGVLARSYFVKSYPDYLVLEFGADHPGDVQALVDMAQPSVGVLTGISAVHAAYFENIEALAKEKEVLILSLPEDGLAILNADEDRVLQVKDRAAAEVQTYGLEGDDLSAENVQISTRLDDSFEPGEELAVTTAVILENGVQAGEISLTNFLGYAPVSSCLAAMAVGRRFGLSVNEMIEVLEKDLMPVAGRLRPLPGIKGTLIIDDSYNASPSAMHNGLDILSMFTPGEEVDRRIAALGSMAELGQYSDEEHRMIGEHVAKVSDIFVAVGEAIQPAVKAAKDAGMQRVEWFATSIEAGRYLDRELQQGDIVYVKGSQSARMEHVVKDIMAQPTRATHYLVRQSDKWLKDV